MIPGSGQLKILKSNWLMKTMQNTTWMHNERMNQTALMYNDNEQHEAWIEG